MRLNLLLAGAALIRAGPAFSHAGHDADLSTLNGGPSIFVSLILAVILYLLGARRLSRAGTLQRVLGRGRRWSFAAGMATLFIALVSPLDALAERSFAMHMTQHLLLMLVAPPLLVWGRPIITWLWAFPIDGRRAIGRFWMDTPGLHSGVNFLNRPLVAWVLASIALWFWHIPGPYGWALANEGVHMIEHLSFFLTSLAFWSLVLKPYEARVFGHGQALILVATFALQNGLLGALLTFAARPLYPAYTNYAFGLSPLEDQQLAGLIMWVPAGLIHLTTMALLFTAWLAAAEDKNVIGTAPSS